jgi:hypothetical protein
LTYTQLALAENALIAYSQQKRPLQKAFDELPSMSCRGLPAVEAALDL